MALDRAGQQMSKAEILATVAPELRPSAAAILESPFDFSELSDESLPRFRQWRSGVTATEGPEVATHTIPGPSGAPDIAVLVANADPETPRPAVVYLHGGGFVMGSAKQDEAIIRQIATECDCVVLAPNYRLAPETRWSGSLEDNYAGLKWTFDRAVELGILSDKIAVMGNSAGGGHAALLAIAARDRGEVPLVCQSLLYPMLDDRTGSSAPAPTHVGNILWTAPANRFGWRSFLGEEPGQPVRVAAGVPARVNDLSGLPPTFIGVGSIDLFVDENIAYARRLIAAGVATELAVVAGAYHGFDLLAPDVPVSRHFNIAKFAALRRALHG